MTVSRDRLEQLRTETHAAAARVASALVEVRAARSDGTADDEHDPEGSTLTSDWSQLEGLSVAASARLEEIDRAIARLDAGLYGTCVRCGLSIGAGRLDARPSADRCLDCARLLDRR